MDGRAVEVMIGRGVPEPGTVVATRQSTSQAKGYVCTATALRYAHEGEELPMVMLAPNKETGPLVVWIAPSGKRALFDTDGRPRAAVRGLLEAGATVIGVDLLGQGEFTSNGKPWDKNRLVADRTGKPTGYAAFTFGYNHPLFSQRVHDVLSVVSYARDTRRPKQEIVLVGLGGAGRWVAAATAVAGNAVDGAAIDTAGFRFEKLTAIDDADFLPGAVKYGDLPGILALAAPKPIWLAGEGVRAPSVVAAAYETSGSPGNLTVFPRDGAEKERAAVAWLLR